MSHLAHRTYDKGGMCYAACMEAFEWYSFPNYPIKVELLNLLVLKRV